MRHHGLTKDETWKGSTLSLSASVTPKTAGSTYTYAWQLVDANGQVVDTSDAPAYNCVVPGYGLYTLKLAVVNTDDPSDRADCTLSNAFVSKPLTNYVVVAAKGVDGAVPPYDSWATASTNLQAAIDSVCVGGTTVVTSGVHKVGDVNVLRGITVEGVCGDIPASLSYKGSKRLIYVNSKGAVLRNLTLRDAIYTGYGSGSSLWVGPSGGTVESCTFIGNKARAAQATIELGGADARLTRCRLVGNTITDGGARTVQMSQGQVDNCLFEANSNTAGRAILSLTGAKARLVNNTFVDNVATGAVLFTAKPTANAMLNCILASTRRADGSTGDEWTTSLTAASDLSALEAAVSNCCFATGTTLGANAVTGDPKFRNAARGDWRLQASSPCFDAGLATPEMEDMTDFAGNPRLKPEQGARAHVDIGCLERGWPGGLLLMVR